MTAIQKEIQKEKFSMVEVVSIKILIYYMKDLLVVNFFKGFYY